MNFSVTSVVLALLVTLMGIAVGTDNDESGNDSFISNRSMRMLMATVRFDNGSDAEIPHYSNLVIAPRHFASIENNIVEGKVSVEIWLQDSQKAHRHFVLTIGTDSGLVALDNRDHLGVDIFKSLYQSINIPKGQALATIYP